MVFVLLFLLGILLHHSLHIRGGEPISFDVECASMYSDMSTLIIASSVPKSTSANAFEVSVFPTPVGPIKTMRVGMDFKVLSIRC